MANNKTIQVILLVPPHSNLLDLAGVAQVFFEAIDHGLKAELKFCTFAEEHITTTLSLPLGKVESYKTVTPAPGDILFIFSTDINYILSGRMAPEPQLLSWIVNAYNNDVTICAICNGAFLLGKTGLLNGRECTTHWKRTRELQQMFPKAQVQENVLFVADEGIITSAGATSGVDVALHLLGNLRDDNFVYKISRELVVYSRRSGGQEQQSVFLSYRNHVHAGIHLVQDWLLANLNKKNHLADLAAIALMSERNFTRTFKKETGLTVNEYITTLRLEKIKELVKNPDLSSAQIASSCGLQSVKHIRRLMALI